MNIALVAPRMSLRPMDSEFKRRMAPSLALLTVAALTPPEHTVRLEDDNVRPVRCDGPADLVGITVNVDTSARAYAIADAFRSRGVPVVLGGIHASANPDEALRHADAVCIGEAEGVWPAIVADAERRQLRRTYRNASPADGNLTPLPRWDLLDPAHYLITNMVYATRGCPFRCDFCYNSADYVHHSHRPRPIPAVIDEIRKLETRQVMFVDDNLLGDPEWTRAFVGALKPLGLAWHAAVSANILQHPDLLDGMREAGCKSLFIGFESINEGSLRRARKRQNKTGDYDRLIAGIHARGMMVNASLVFGFDQDGPDVFDRTTSWLIDNRVETMTAHILTPYPGTQRYASLLKEGRITDFDWSHYNTSTVVFQPRGMSADELRDGYLRAYDRFYSLASIWRRLPGNPGSRLPYLLFNLGYRKFGKVTSLFAGSGGMRAVHRIARRLAYSIE